MIFNNFENLKKMKLPSLPFKCHNCDVSDNEVKFCEDCQKWVKPPKCNHCGNEDLIPDWTY